MQRLAIDVRVAHDKAVDNATNLSNQIISPDSEYIPFP